MLNQQLNYFNSLIKDTRQISVVYNHFGINTLDDLLRWQWTQSVSAMDKYFHDVIRIGLLNSFNKKIIPTKAYSNFPIPLSVIDDPILLQYNFEQYVIRKLSFNSYQSPDKINEGLSLIWNEDHKWQVIANDIGLDKRYLTNKLNLISQRRNQIVHQGDYPSNHLEKESITLAEVQNVIDFIELIVSTIHNNLIKDFAIRTL